MENEKIIYTEVYTVLSKLPKTYIDKIPQAVKEDIFNKASTDYSYKINKLLPESKAFILAIIMAYFDETELNININKYINFCEEKKSEEYNNKSHNFNELFKNENKSMHTPSEEKQIENTSLIKHEGKNFFHKILDKIKGFFRSKEIN